MSEVVIRVDSISKQYRIGRTSEKYRTLRDKLAESLQWRRQRKQGSHAEFIWALRNVSFEVKRGEVVGILGANGAGKTTILKILSRITEPTSGTAEMKGRCAALLEVGTGFHQELTGRENIFLNGAILGMRRAEIERKLDEIVHFAEVERFIDTPVKHYSSGMYLRLAFSVAAHLEPDILFVDEVLAVGDAAFQKKCIGKMEQVAQQGRTVLFVSHNLGVIRELCQSCIVLTEGQLAFRGSMMEGLAFYSSSLMEDRASDPVRRTGWHRVAVKNKAGDLPHTIERDNPIAMNAVFDTTENFVSARLFCILHDAVGNLVIHSRVNSADLLQPGMQAGRYEFEVQFPVLWLAPGVYTLHFKFIGRTADLTEVRQLSERIILDVQGAGEGIGRALMAPDVKWHAKVVLAVQQTKTDRKIVSI